MNSNQKWLGIFPALALALVGCGGGSTTTAHSAPSSASGGSSNRSATPPSSGTKSPIKVPVLLPLTGQAAFLGKEEQQAVVAYQQYTNQNGGINGRPLQFVVQDSASSPKLAVQLASPIIKSHAGIFVGPSLVSTCSALGPLVTNGPVEYCLSPGVYPPPNGYQFGGAMVNQWAISTMLNYFKMHHWTKVAALVTNDATGADGLKWLKELLATPEFSSLKLVTTQHFDNTATSISSQMSVIAGAHPDALFTWATGTPQEIIFKGIQQAGLNIPVSMCDGDQSNAEMKAYSNILPKNFFTAVGRYAAYNILPPGPGKDAVQAFDQAFAAKNIKPDIGQALAWDAVAVVVQAIRKEGPNATAKQYLDYMQSIKNFQGASGTFNFSPTDHHGVGAQDFYVVTYNPSSGNWVPLSGPGGSALPQSG